MGSELLRAGRYPEACDALTTAISSGADDVVVWVRLAQAINGIPAFNSPNEAVREWLLRLAQYPGISQALLHGPITRYLFTGRSFAELWVRAGAPGLVVAEADLETLADPLLIALLHRGSPLTLEIERLATGARRLLIASDLDAPELRCALAASAIASEFAWAETPEETARIEALGAQLAGAGDADPKAVATYAAYRPLHLAPWASGLAHRNWPAPFDDLIRLALIEPLEEQEIARTIPRFGAIAGEVSKAVQAQYEQNPYPRWLSLARPPADPLPETIKRGHPLADLSGLQWPARPQILIAGCGTGRQAIEVALRHPAGEVLALDLSRSSLAYGKRKAMEMGVQNLQFGQADLMDVDLGDRRFDLIESVGVLHHLERPREGWRRLVDMLRPGGLMTIALYSRAARAWLADLRQRYGVRDDAQGIRDFRQQLMVAEPRHAILSTIDFYSLSDCRDLVFHVQETQFSLDEIAQILPGLGLRFLGFSMPYAQLDAYDARFPDDPARTSLAHWAELEAEQPGLFLGMYHFWAIKTGQ